MAKERKKLSDRDALRQMLDCTAVMILGTLVISAVRGSFPSRESLMWTGISWLGIIGGWPCATGMTTGSRPFDRR